VRVPCQGEPTAPPGRAVTRAEAPRSRRRAGVTEAIADGLRAPGLQSRLDEIEERKAALAAELDAAPPPAPRLHPNLAEVYRKKVADLQTALADPATHTEALEILRALIERVEVRQVEVRQAEDGFAIELLGEIARMVTLSAGAESVMKEPYRSR
jgi:hypothetical protein